MRRNKITIVLVAGFLLTGQVSALAQGDRPSSGGDAPAPAAEAADAPAKAATPSSETGMTPAAREPSISLAPLPQDLSPWGMFLHADTIVKAVMIGLAVASLVTWTVWVAKSIELLLRCPSDPLH
jgi:biopolymer transport protein ExbB